MKYFTQACKIVKRGDDIAFEHVPRDQNVEANELAQIAWRYRLSKEKFKSLIQIKDKLLDEYEVLNIDIFFLDDWHTHLVEYLKNPQFPIEQKIKYRVANYVILGDDSFKRGVDGTLLQCLSEIKAYVALVEVHEGICGSHQVGEKMKWTLFRLGIYWPTILKDCIDYAKS